MTTTRKHEYRDAKTNVKVVLCGLWISMLFVFAQKRQPGRLQSSSSNHGSDPPN